MSPVKIVFVDLEIVRRTKRMYKIGAIKLKGDSAFKEKMERPLTTLHEESDKTPDEKEAELAERDPEKFFYREIRINSELSEDDYDTWRKNTLKDFHDFAKDADYLCNHNMISFDSKYLKTDVDDVLGRKQPFNYIDTLTISPLLLAEYPVHRLGKDYKEEKAEGNEVKSNLPMEDAAKCQNLLVDEGKRYNQLLNDETGKVVISILYRLLNQQINNNARSGKGRKRVTLKEKLHTEHNFFFELMEYNLPVDRDAKTLVDDIKTVFKGELCFSKDSGETIEDYIRTEPIALAYLLSNVYIDAKRREYNTELTDKVVIPPYVLRCYPSIERIDRALRQRKCQDKKCPYCSKGRFDAKKGLKDIFDYSTFSTFMDSNGKKQALQENAVNDALAGESMLSIFPTGGGKSIAFQLPAMMQWEMNGALTLVISPLQSLMNDQVNGLETIGIQWAAQTINGSTKSIRREKILEDVYSGKTSILYVSPESLRSRWMRNLMRDRCIARVVIDEAHCFSGWGHDFRPDYRYIGRFIRDLQADKGDICIPVSCYTATADEHVRTDILNYFKEELGIKLKKNYTEEQRPKLIYQLYEIGVDYSECFGKRERDEKCFQEKLKCLKELLLSGWKFEKKMLRIVDAPLIIYVSTRKHCDRLFGELQEYFRDNNTNNLPSENSVARFHGGMNKNEKEEVLLRFRDTEDGKLQQDALRIVIATNAFGMGVDKKDVRNVIHFDISKSFEDYVQEAGRGGRDKKEAHCHILYTKEDLDLNDSLFLSSYIDRTEIDNVWQVLREQFTKAKEKNGERRIQISLAELSRSTNMNKEKCRQAIRQLESEGFLDRGENITRVYAGVARDPVDADKEELCKKLGFEETEKKVRLSRNVDALVVSLREAKKGDDGLNSDELVRSMQIDIANRKGDSFAPYGIRLLERIMELLAERDVLSMDIDVRLFPLKKTRDLKEILDLELKMFEKQKESNPKGSLEMNKLLGEVEDNIGSRRYNQLNCLYNYWVSEGLARRATGGRLLPAGGVRAADVSNYEDNWERMEAEIKNRQCHCLEILKYLEELKEQDKNPEDVGGELIKTLNEKIEKEEEKIRSIRQLHAALRLLNDAGIVDVQDCGFVMNQKMTLYLNPDEFRKKRGAEYTNCCFSDDDYARLRVHYLKSVSQRFILEAFLDKLRKKQQEEIQKYIRDFFWMRWDDFCKTYLPEGYDADKKLEDLLKQYIETDADGRELDEAKKNIIKDTHRIIYVKAGPGSGKTTLIVNKCAMFLRNKSIQPEEILALSFTNAARDVLRKRLLQKLGNDAKSIRVKTFHAFSCELLGIPGSIEDSNIEKAEQYLNENPDLIDEKLWRARVLVLDEAQDLNADQYELVKRLMIKNRDNDIRLVMVGDIDQGIFEWDDSVNVGYMGDIYDDDEISEDGERVEFELVYNYRSAKNIVKFTENYREKMPEHENRKSLNPDPCCHDEGIIRLYCGDDAETELLGKVIEDQKNPKEGRTEIAILCGLNPTAERIYNKLRGNVEKSTALQLIHGVKKSDRHYFSLSRLDEVWALLERMRGSADENGRIDRAGFNSCIKSFQEAYENSRYKEKVKKFAEETFELLADPYDREAVVEVERFVNEFRSIRFNEFIDLPDDDASVRITVSTIYKIKGREYDRVYIYPDKEPIDKEDEDDVKDNYKMLFVGMTRAKTELDIFLSADSFYKDVLEKTLNKSSIKPSEYIYPRDNERGNKKTAERSIGKETYIFDLCNLRLGYDAKYYYDNNTDFTPRNEYYQDVFLTDHLTNSDNSSSYWDTPPALQAQCQCDSENKWDIRRIDGGDGSFFVVEIENVTLERPVEDREDRNSDEQYRSFCETFNEYGKLSAGIYAVVVYDIEPAENNERLKNKGLTDNGMVLGFNRENQPVVKAVRKVFLPEVSLPEVSLPEESTLDDIVKSIGESSYKTVFQAFDNNPTEYQLSNRIKALLNRIKALLGENTDSQDQTNDTDPGNECLPCVFRCEDEESEKECMVDLIKAIIKNDEANGRKTDIGVIVRDSTQTNSPKYIREYIEERIKNVEVSSSDSTTTDMEHNGKKPVNVISIGIIDANNGANRVVYKFCDVIVFIDDIKERGTRRKSVIKSACRSLTMITCENMSMLQGVDESYYSLYDYFPDEETVN